MNFFSQHLLNIGIQVIVIKKHSYPNLETHPYSLVQYERTQIEASDSLEIE